MAGISSKSAGSLENKKKYNGIEWDNDLDLAVYDAFFRELDPQTGRWWQIDPKIENMEMWSPYASMFGNPITNSDPLGDYPGPGDPPDKKWHPPMAAPQGNTNTLNPSAPLIYQGLASIKAENVRTQYNKDAAKLAPNDKQGRADLKEKARANTPEPFKSTVEKGRPMAGEQAKVKDPSFKGNATKTNAEVNDVVKTTGTLGKVFVGAAIVQSTVTIATSNTPVREAATEGAGWAGATYVGGQFAVGGTAIGGVWGGFAGGVIGSTLGFVGGKQLGNAVLNAAPIIKASMKEYNQNHPIEQSGNLIYHICFTKGTLVYGKEKFVPIDEIKVGDIVYSYNIEGKQIELSKVTNILSRQTESLYVVTVGDEVINVTAEHPFYVINNGWIKAKDLKKGDILKSVDDKANVVISGITEKQSPVTVYNIEVDGNHNYFVTMLRLLVHNKKISEIKEEKTVNILQ